MSLGYDGIWWWDLLGYHEDRIDFWLWNLEVNPRKKQQIYTLRWRWTTTKHAVSKCEFNRTKMRSWWWGCKKQLQHFYKIDYFELFSSQNVPTIPTISQLWDFLISGYLGQGTPFLEWNDYRGWFHQLKKILGKRVDFTRNGDSNSIKKRRIDVHDVASTGLKNLENNKNMFLEKLEFNSLIKKRRM